MPENPMPDEERTDLWRVMQGAEAVDSIRHAQECLATAGGFAATLNTLDNVVTRIRADTGYSDGDLDEEDRPEPETTATKGG